MSTTQSRVGSRHPPLTEPVVVEPPATVPTIMECAMSGKSKGGREVRKPKQTPKPKPAKEGTDASRVVRQSKLPRSK